MSDWRQKVEQILAETAQNATVITYRDLAQRAGVPPPGRIAAVTGLLEEMIAADHFAGRPLRAAVAVSRARDGRPGPGFFQCCRTLGRYFGPDHGAQADTLHAIELQRLYAAVETDAVDESEPR